MSDPSTSISEAPPAHTEDDTASSESSYAGSDEATASGQDSEEITRRAALTTEDGSTRSGSRRDSMIGKGKQRLVPVVDEEDEAGGAVDSTNSNTDPTKAANSPVNESVVDFMKAVPGPSEQEASNPSGKEPQALGQRPGYGDISTGGEPISDSQTSEHRSGSLQVASGTQGAEPQIGRDEIWQNPQPDAASLGDARRNAMYLHEGSSSISGTSQAGSQSRQDSFVLPRWQPDAEVTYCPICNTQFSFFVRKHHCRKCGRVVCNSCSPHRITIPYQFIVQDINQQGPPPSPSEMQGGLKVRLCNPCVPDPNTLPPTQQPPPSYYISAGDRGLNLTEETINYLERQSRPLPVGGRERDLHSSQRARAATAASGTSSSNDRRQGQRTDPAHSRYDPVSISGAGSSYPHSRMSARIESMGRTRHNPADASQSRGHVSRHQSLSVTSSGTTNNRQEQYRSILDPSIDRNRPLPPVPRIAEEDECPICHLELPSRTLPSFETLREQHIMQCIEEQMYANSGRQPRPGAYTSASNPAPAITIANRQGSSPNQSSPSSSAYPIPSTSNPLTSNIRPTPIPNTAEARTAAREQAHAAVVLGQSSQGNRSSPPHGAISAHRKTSYFPYMATEKDCVDDAECTICLEEFEVGQEMARLECFCRFHRSCIREWFASRPGRCPVHQHDGSGY